MKKSIFDFFKTLSLKQIKQNFLEGKSSTSIYGKEGMIYFKE